MRTIPVNNPVRVTWLLAGLIVAVAPIGAASEVAAQDAPPDPPDPTETSPADPELASTDPTSEDVTASLPSPSTGAAEPALQESEWSEQGIGVQLGAAFGGRVTPGGLRLVGNYLYRLSDTDWFDGAAAFTIGSGDAACFRDRDGDRVCDHGAVDGFAVDFIAAVRRTWPGKKQFAPFARLGVGLRFARFSGDQLAGLAVPLVGAGGLTVDLTPAMRLVAVGQLELGAGVFSRGYGAGPQLGLSISAGIEFALR